MQHFTRNKIHIHNQKRKRKKKRNQNHFNFLIYSMLFLFSEKNFCFHFVLMYFLLLHIAWIHIHSYVWVVYAILLFFVAIFCFFASFTYPTSISFHRWLFFFVCFWSLVNANRTEEEDLHHRHERLEATSLAKQKTIRVRSTIYSIYSGDLIWIFILTNKRTCFWNILLHIHIAWMRPRMLAHGMENSFIDKEL